MSDPRPPSAFPPIDISLRGDDHVRLYRETNGEQGYLWNGAPTLLLTSKGRKSGTARTIPIIYTSYNGSYVIIASKGGSPTHPLWYLNLLQDPHVQVQVKAEFFDAIARTAESPERERIWAEAVKTWPRYDEYQSRISRRIPVVVLDPVWTR
jgi:deazaflavin-dependent oxidoreductase (nitroreductase family)